MTSPWNRFVTKLRQLGAPATPVPGDTHAEPRSRPEDWLGIFHDALERRTAVDPDTLASIASHLGSASIETLLPTAQAREQLVDLLRPRAGMTGRLGDMRKCGLLGRLFPEMPPVPPARPGRVDPSPDRVLASIKMLESLLTGETLPRERFGTMLLELTAPEALVIAFAVRDAPDFKAGREQPAALAHAVGTRLALPDGTVQALEFLLRNQAQMSQVALRRDTNDPDVIHAFAGLFQTEEQLKMLCLLTMADAGASGGEGLSPWKLDVFWRLFVDTYNDLTMGYGDDVIDVRAAALETLRAHRPPSISETELTSFLEGLPKRYLSLFEKEDIYGHVELCRNLTPDDIHYAVKARPNAWELTIVSLDKPYLFSNVCGVLSWLDVNIVRGYALTSLKGVVIDVFQFTERQGSFTASRLEPILHDAIRGRVDVASLLQRPGANPAAAPPAEPPVLYFDNDSSQRYTILEIVAADSPGLLYRVSRALSEYGCEVDLVLISTEGPRAIDVFHLTRNGEKLGDADEFALTELLERSLA